MSDLAVSAVQRATGMHLDPFKAYNFVVEVHGILVGGFQSVEGVAANSEVLVVREGGANNVEYKLPGQITYGELVLSSGLTFLDPMWLWYRSTLVGKPLRKNGTIFLLDDSGSLVAWWDFHNAWPREWVGPSLDATNALVAVQRFTLVCERIVKGLSSSAAGLAVNVAGKLS